jgi:uncharacterized repeat protein (TIGR03803 family)
MHSAATNGKTKGALNISAVAPKVGSTKLAAAAIRAALTLAVLCALLLAAARPAVAQTETVIWDFNANPDSSLIFDGAGNLYGTTWSGGAFEYGSVYELSPNGSGGWNETDLYSFCSAPNCADGARPSGPLIFDSEGNLYGTASYGGNNECGSNPQTGCGLIFELTPAGANWTETVLYSFCPEGSCPANPQSGVIFDPAGNLYGAFYNGVFELSRSGDGWTEQTVYGGGGLSTGGLTMDSSGDIFSVTFDWVFELSPNGEGGWNPTVIHTFAGAPSDGYDAQGTPVLDQAGNLYGTTYAGGSLCKPDGGCGTVYKLSPGPNGWTEKILHHFGAKDDGRGPVAGIVLDRAGNMYGTTVGGGEYGDGTVFELVAPVGTSKAYKEKILWSFNGFEQGWDPSTSLILDSAGNLYGTTEYGGSLNGCAYEVTGVPVTTTTTLTSSPNPSTYGEAVTFTAAVTSLYGALPPNGETVSFMKGKTVLGTGTLNGGAASLITSVLKATAKISAVYGGDSSFYGSTSNTLVQVVEKP